MRIYFVILILITVVDSSFAQDLFEKYPGIQRVTDGIDSGLSTYDSVKVINEEVTGNMTDGGAELTGYFSNGTIQKMDFKVGLSYGINHFEFYYLDSELYFILESFHQFEYNSQTESLNYTKTNQTFNGRYYFGKPFDYLTLGHNRFEDDNLDPETVLSEEAETYLDLLKSKQ